MTRLAHLLKAFRLPAPAAALLAVALGLSSAASAPISASDARTVFRQANEQYQQQNYPQARALYSQLVEQGVVSPEVYYNLGNAAARLGRTGEAVLYFEKARRLAPRDADIAANLRRVSPPGNDPAPFVLGVPFSWLLNRLSLAEWMGTFLLLFSVVGVLGAALLSRTLPPAALRLVRPALAAFSVAALVCGLFATVRYTQDKTVTTLIVMSPERVLRSGPGDNFSQLISLPEGTKLRRLDFRDDPEWTRVELPNGRTGYTPTFSLRPV